MPVSSLNARQRVERIDATRVCASECYSVGDAQRARLFTAFQRASEIRGTIGSAYKARSMNALSDMALHCTFLANDGDTEAGYSNTISVK